MRPLEHLRILDLSRLLPGPYCTLLFADLGAEVVKADFDDEPLRPGLRLSDREDQGLSAAGIPLDDDEQADSAPVPLEPTRIGAGAGADRFESQSRSTER